MMLRFGATSFVAVVALRLLVEGHSVTTRVGRLEYLPLSMLVETRGLAAAPGEISGGCRWRVADDPVRHVLRMAAWNAMGWPERPASSPRWRPALSSLTEEGVRVCMLGRCEEAGGVARWYRWCRTSDLPPRLERVEEETPTVMEVVNETPADLCGRKVVSAPPEVPWTHVDAACPASASRSTESA